MNAEGQSDAPRRQGLPRIASIPPEAGREAWNRFSLMALKGASPASALILDYQPPRLRQYVAQFMVLCYGSPRGLIPTSIRASGLGFQSL